MITATLRLRDGREVVVTSAARDLLFDNELTDVMVRLDEDMIAAHVPITFVGKDGQRDAVIAADVVGLSIEWRLGQ